MTEYEAIPEKVRAFRAPMDIEVQGVDVPDGHWVVVGENGSRHVLSDGEFKDKYRTPVVRCLQPHNFQISGTQISPMPSMGGFPFGGR